MLSSSFIYAQTANDVVGLGDKGFRYVIDINNPAIKDISQFAKVHEITDKIYLFVYDLISSEKNSLPLDPISNPLKANNLDQIMLAGEDYGSFLFNPLPLSKPTIFILSFSGLLWLVRKTLNAIASDI